MLGCPYHFLYLFDLIILNKKWSYFVFYINFHAHHIFILIFTQIILPFFYKYVEAKIERLGGLSSGIRGRDGSRVRTAESVSTDSIVVY